MTWEEDVANIEAALEYAWRHGYADYRPAVHRTLFSRPKLEREFVTRCTITWDPDKIAKIEKLLMPPEAGKGL